MFEEITIQQQGVSAKVSALRGALVTSITIAGKELLYLDRATFADPMKNVRGGIPVLFPFAGKLDHGTFLAAGSKMNQHGFGRNKSWRITEQLTHRLRMTLRPDAETLAQYPYEFIAEQSCMIVPRGFQIELLVCNMDAKPMPVSPGWHPYFSCAAENKKNVTGDVPGLDSSQFSDDKEFDFGLRAPQNGRATFNIPALGRVLLSFDPRMRHLQFWSQRGKDFICLEPFSGPNNTINTEKRVDIPSGEARTFWVRIELAD